MNPSIDHKEKLKHPYYQIMDLKDIKLKAELKSWSRLELINWLAWNDRNGIYKDEDSMREFNNILGKTEAISIIIEQISSGQK